ncbi:hypertrehalosaemic prohormone-like [Ylistrum balloti]|uniref:hypertrehalosaemic prohormone-like n=1 Tax=Ylistrum balloti TaxID=509963 RepID=UPI002905EF70|nr:hypertrehalosaemic prohormone-like [Ylistrum balloti]
MISKWILLLLIVSSVVLLTSAQISFSTSWGSGKRAAFTEPVNPSNINLDSTCMSRTEPEVLMELVKTIQKQTERVIECLMESKVAKQRQRSIHYS